MNDSSDVVFFFDCDNTLLDNDAIRDDLRDRLARDFGSTRAGQYWAIFEALRAELGYADYLGALQRFRPADISDAALLQMSAFLLDYPFASRLYPGALDLLRDLQSRGPTVILSDGDVVFQPRKLQRSGLWDAVDGRVLIYVHKEAMLDAVARCYPARHYVMVDDKLSILSAMKEKWQHRLTTVWPRQGHYANDPQYTSGYPAPDVTVERIGELVPDRLATLRHLRQYD
jgi:FMN phosphatase YigB (HAD superfamily)